MSYLYNMFEGSLDELSARFEAVDLTDLEAVTTTVLGDDPDPEDVADLDLDEDDLAVDVTGPLVLAALIERFWVPTDEELLNWLDWHEQDELLEAAQQRLTARGADLIGDLFEAPPLGVHPLGWGFRGSLTHAEVVDLRDELTAILPAAVVDAASAHPTDVRALADGWPVEVPLSWVLISLRGVGAGRDVAVRLE